jgi:hypothetical protein
MTPLTQGHRPEVQAQHPRAPSLGYGTLIVESAGQIWALNRIDYRPRPEEVYEALSELVFGETGKRRATGFWRVRAGGADGGVARPSRLLGVPTSALTREVRHQGPERVLATTSKRAPSPRWVNSQPEDVLAPVQIDSDGQVDRPVGHRTVEVLTHSIDLADRPGRVRRPVLPGSDLLVTASVAPGDARSGLTCAR